MLGTQAVCAGPAAHDVEVYDVFVPVSRSMSFTDPPVERGPL